MEFTLTEEHKMIRDKQNFAQTELLTGVIERVRTNPDEQIKS